MNRLDLEAGNSAIRLIGVDLAWLSDRNGSGIAIGTVSGKRLRMEEVHVSVVGLDNVCFGS